MSHALVKHGRYSILYPPRARRILIMEINAQYYALSKAVKTRLKIENIYCVTFRLKVPIQLGGGVFMDLKRAQKLSSEVQQPFLISFHSF